MKIDFNILIQDSGEKLTQADIAREMVNKGLFKSFRSAVNTIQRCNSGKTKGVSWDMIKFLVHRFKKPGSDIIKWNDN